MARIRMLQAVAGADFSWSPGDVVDLPDERAAAWADGVRAELVDDGEDGQRRRPSAAAAFSAGAAQARAGGTPPEDPPELYDPAVHTVRDVLDYLADATETEVIRVLDIEAAGEDRKGIAREREHLLGHARERDAARPPENTAETSRGGGRGDATIETR